MIILFLLSALIATIAVTIALGLAVLVVYLWRKWITALRGFQVLNNGYQSLVHENAYLQALLSERVELLNERSELTREITMEPLFIPNRSNTLH